MQGESVSKHLTLINYFAVHSQETLARILGGSQPSRNSKPGLKLSDHICNNTTTPMVLLIDSKRDRREREGERRGGGVQTR